MFVTYDLAIGGLSFRTCFCLRRCKHCKIDEGYASAVTWRESLIRTVLYCVFVVVAFQFSVFAAAVLLTALGGADGFMILLFAVAGTCALLWLAWRGELWVRAKMSNKDSTPDVSE